MGKKGDLSDFEHGMVFGARRAGMSILKTADLLGYSRTNISRVYREWSEKEKMPCWCQRRMGRLVRDGRKGTVTQIITHYNQGMRNTISKRTTCQTLKQMGYITCISLLIILVWLCMWRIIKNLEPWTYSSRRRHRVPLLSATNRKQRLQFAQARQNWRIEDWKNVAWSEESWFLLRLSDGRVGIWHKEHKSMDPSCLVSTVQAGGVGIMVWGIFSWHTLGPLVPTVYRLNTIAFLSIVADHAHPFMTTHVYPSSRGYFQ